VTRWGLSGQPIGDDDAEPDTNWRTVILRERKFFRLARKADRCEVCHRPMVCGQYRAHASCDLELASWPRSRVPASPPG